MDLASAISLRYFRSLEVVDTKPDNTPVTVADREVEQMLRDLIAKHYPDHGICGEEYSTLQSHSPWTWVIDPIDGTSTDDRPIRGIWIPQIPQLQGLGLRHLVFSNPIS